VLTHATYHIQTRCSAFRKMKKPIKILVLIITLGFMSCSSSFIQKTRNKNINLINLSETSRKIGFENDLIIALFDTNDLIPLLEKYNEEYPRQRTRLIIDNLKTIKTDLIFNEKENKGLIDFQEFEMFFHNLLKEGKSKIILKENNQNLSKIKYTFIQDRLGGEDGYFSLENGTEIYRVLLALGE